MGNRVYLRGLDESDLEGHYFDWFDDQEVCKGNSHGYFPNNPQRMASYLKRVYDDSSLLVLAIVTKENDIHIGNISLQNIDWISRSAEYAILLGEKEFWGKGLAKEASDLLLYHGFVRLNLFRIYCGTFDNNIAMQKLADYMGMKKEGLRRKASFKGGLYRDVIEYGILRDEYLKRNTGVQIEL